MARAQLKILVFLITVGLVAGTLSIAWWFYTNVLLKENQLERDIAAMKGKDRPVIDPGAKRFEAAIDLIREGKVEEGRDALYKLRQQFPDSGTCAEAMRIIGEINMDRLFSATNTAGKKDYIVQPGDSLNLIAGKHGTTVDSIIRLSGLMSFNLQPGDHLTIIPMDFSLGVMVSKKQVILFRQVGDKSYPFKFYQAKDIRLPPGARLPMEMEIAGKTALYDGKQVAPTDPAYIDADKSFPGTKAGLSIRTPPVAKAIPIEEPKSKAKGAVAAIPTPSTSAETGIFLDREDIEELFALLRKGSKLSLMR
ncbi:MAG: LysM peptidoglycan-binding domain-containing protein [Verrucomicrobiaceae bacterium]